jgi:hypothetical protein
MRAGMAYKGLALAGAAALTLAGAVRPASGATSPSWRVVKNVGTASGSWASDFSISGPANAWSTWTALSPGGGSPALTVQHWNGGSWRQVPIPLSLTVPADVSVAFGASSAKNAWLIDQPNGTTTPVVRWNGHNWKAWAIPPWALVWNESNIYRITTAFFSWRDVWLFSLGPGYHFGPGDRGTIARYNGRSWTGTSVPVILNQVSVLSRNDIWGFGAGGGRVTRKLSGYSLVNWNGHRWLTVRVPKAQLPGQTFLANPVALGPKDVWLDLDATGVTDGLVHWNGRSWSQLAIPAQISRVTAMAQDGHGGLWLIGHGPLPADTYYFAHLSGGSWITQTMPPDQSLTAGALTGISWIPGTRSVWAGAEYSSPGGSVGAILKYGP